MRRRRLLIVDDEETIVFGLLRVLYQDNARYDTLLASSAEIAQDILRETPVDVMVTDVRLPGINGIDLLCWAANESPQTRVIVITAFDIAQLRDKAFRFGCLEIVQKPFDLHEMRQLVADVMENRDGFYGSLGSLSAADIIQVLCLGQRTSAVRVTDGASFGIIHIDKGEVVHAIHDSEVGEKAVYRILRTKQGSFNTLPLPRDAPRTVHVPWQHLLIEGMRIDDELRAGLRKSSIPPPRASAVPSPVNGAATPAKTWDDVVARVRKPSPSRESDVMSLIDRGFEALKDRDYDLARQVWEQALGLDPENRLLELNLRKLERLKQA
jgi:DNA-binding NarL/FixJ family response regulator